MKKFSEIYAPFFGAKEKKMESFETLYGYNGQGRQAAEEEEERKRQEATVINPESGRALPTQAEAFAQYEKLRAQFGEE